MCTGRSPWTHCIEEDILLECVACLSYPIRIVHTILCDIIKHIRCSYKVSVVKIWNILVLISVICDKSLTCWLEDKWCEPTVYAVSLLVSSSALNIFWHHVIPCVPIPLAFLIKLVWIIKTSSVYHRLIICDNRTWQEVDRCNKVLAVKSELLCNVLDIAPHNTVEINDIINRLEHFLDTVCRECHRLLIPEHIRWIVRHKSCCELIILVHWWCLRILDLTALFLKKSKVGSLFRLFLSWIYVKIRKPLQLLFRTIRDSSNIVGACYLYLINIRAAWIAAWWAAAWSYAHCWQESHCTGNNTLGIFHYI